MPQKVNTKRAPRADGTPATLIGEADVATLLGISRFSLRDLRIQGRVNPDLLIKPLSDTLRGMKPGKGVKVWYDGDTIADIINGKSSVDLFVKPTEGDAA